MLSIREGLYYKKHSWEDMSPVLNKPSPPRVLVLTLYSGEGEYNDCKSSVASQEGVHCKHAVFEWLPNREAHESLYKEIMNCTRDFDCFIKLDADMVLASNNSLLLLCEMLLANPNLDHLSLPVFDVPSGTYLMGVNLFSPRVRWTLPMDPLFPDRNPDIPGERRVDYSHQFKYIYHMPAPKEEQAFALGFHRATKIVQHNSRGGKKSAAFPLSYLKRVSENQHFDRRLKELVLSGMFVCLISSSSAIESKSTIAPPEKENAFVRALVELFQMKASRLVIFLFLRIRYIHARAGVEKIVEAFRL